MKNLPRVTLVGGGLVGSLLAVMLARRGYGVDVFEKRPDMRRFQISAGRSINLALAARGILALERAGIMDEVRPLLIPMRGRLLHLPDGNQEFSPYGQRDDEVIYSVSRLLLNQVLLSAAERMPSVRLMFEQECIACEPESRILRLRDLVSGQEMQQTYAWLIGTDGANSATREAIATRGGGRHATEWLDHDYKELSIPADRQGKFQMEREALHIWPRKGFMLIALPNLDGSFTVTLFLQKQGPISFAQLTDGPQVRAFFEQYFSDAAELIPDLEQDFFENPTGVLGTVRASAWTDGECGLLLGDAAHAIVPFHGQGMNAGFEDCRVLDDYLQESGDDWQAVLRPYEKERIPCGNAIADLALENYITMRDSVLDPLFQLKKEIGFEIERRYPERFIPQYSMVMFHPEISYAEAQARGRRQDKLLTRLARDLGDSTLQSASDDRAQRMGAVQWQQVERWLEEGV